MGCKRYDGCIICVLFQFSWQLQTQIVKDGILSDSLLGNKLYNVHLPIMLESERQAVYRERKKNAISP